VVGITGGRKLAGIAGSDRESVIKMRNKIWYWSISKLPEGIILPWWAITIRAIIFPLDFIYWRMSKSRGYQWKNDTWIINGVRYSGKALYWMSVAQGETYRIRRDGKTVTFEQVQ
jgi:hypothetical protein